jgi:hypothetical protein
MAALAGCSAGLPMSAGSSAMRNVGSSLAACSSRRVIAKISRFCRCDLSALCKTRYLPGAGHAQLQLHWYVSFHQAKSSLILSRFPHKLSPACGWQERQSPAS